MKEKKRWKGKEKKITEEEKKTKKITEEKRI